MIAGRLARTRSNLAAPLARAGRLGVLLALAACAPAEPAGPAVPYGLSDRPILPFPTDALLVADPSTVTGLRVALGPSGTNLGDVDEALFLFGEEFAAALERQDGWSNLGPVFAQVPEAADPASLDGHVLLVDLAARRIVPTVAKTFGGKTSYGRELHWVSARAPLPLQPKTRHAIVLVRGLRSAAGVPFERDPGFGALFDGRDLSEVPGRPEKVAAARVRLEGVREALQAVGVRAEDVLVADTYTTESVSDETEVLAAAYRAADAPVIELDPDGDGAPNVWARPSDDPRWEGPASADDGTIARLVRFETRVPSFREGPKGRLVVDKAQATLQGWETVEGLLTIPAGRGPFPVLLFQHGIGDRKEQMWRYAKELAAEGVAVVAFDAPLHGARTRRPASSATAFLDISAPAVVVDNFRQAETEHTYFARVIDALAAEDLLGDGTRPLDPSRLFWLGHSLGSIIGAAAIGIEPRYEGGVLVVGGGTLLEFLDRILGGFALHEYPAELFVSVAQAALDKGDPTNYAARSADKQVLLMQAMQDETIPARATESLGRALGLPQIEPVLEVVDGLGAVAAPTTRRGLAQYSPARHSLAYAPGDAEETYRAARSRLFHFVGSWAQTGTAEIR